MKTILGIVLPLLGYLISAVVLGIDNGTKKGVPAFLSDAGPYFTAVGFVGQVFTVFSFGFGITVRNFFLFVLLASVVGMMTYCICLSAWKASIKQHPTFQAAVKYCRENQVEAIICSVSAIRFSSRIQEPEYCKGEKIERDVTSFKKWREVQIPSHWNAANQFIHEIRSPYADIARDDNGLQRFESKDLKLFAGLLAQAIGGCGVAYHKLTVKQWGVGSYTVTISGSSGSVTPNASADSRIAYEDHYIYKKSGLTAAKHR